MDSGSQQKERGTPKRYADMTPVIAPKVGEPEGDNEVQLDQLRSGFSTSSSW